MKKFALLVGGTALLALLGAGCAADEPTAGTPTNNANTNTSQPPSTNTNAPTAANLKDLPNITPPATPIDDSNWATMKTKTGLTLRTPTKSVITPTNWSYTPIDNNDPHLQGGCYIADGVVYKSTPSFTNSKKKNACLTTTELVAGPGERTDYFVFQTDEQDSKGKTFTRTHLLTMKKVFKANFDMNAYGAAVEHIVKIFE